MGDARAQHDADPSPGHSTQSLAEMESRLEQLSNLLDALDGPLEALGSTASAATTPQHLSNFNTPQAHTNVDYSQASSQRRVPAQHRHRYQTPNGNSAEKGESSLSAESERKAKHVGVTFPGFSLQETPKAASPQSVAPATGPKSSSATQRPKLATPAAAGVFQSLLEEVLVDEVQDWSIISDTEHPLAPGSNLAPASAFSSMSRWENSDSVGDFQSLRSNAQSSDNTNNPRGPMRHLQPAPILHKPDANEPLVLSKFGNGLDSRHRNRSSSPITNRQPGGGESTPPNAHKGPPTLAVHHDFFVDDDERGGRDLPILTPFDDLFSGTPPADPRLRLELGTGSGAGSVRRALHSPVPSHEGASVSFHDPPTRPSREISRFTIEESARPLPPILSTSVASSAVGLNPAPSGARTESGDHVSAHAWDAHFPVHGVLQRGAAAAGDTGPGSRHLDPPPGQKSSADAHGVAPMVPYLGRAVGGGAASAMRLGVLGGARTVPASLQPMVMGAMRPGVLSPGDERQREEVRRLGSGRPGVLCDGRQDAEWLGGHEALASWGRGAGEKGEVLWEKGEELWEKGGMLERAQSGLWAEREARERAGGRVGEREGGWEGRERRVSEASGESVEDACRLRVGWQELLRNMRGFCEETGGGSGTWVDGGQCFALGVERDVEAEKAERAGGRRGAGRARVVLRLGFAEGRDGRAGLPAGERREKKHHRVRKERKVKFEEFTASPSGGVAFGRIGWSREQDPVSFVRCSTRWNPAILPDMLRFFVEHVWGLVRPNLIISVIGCHKELDVRLDHRVKLAQVMHVAAETGAWVVTGGLDSGVSRLVADARSEVENQVPLLGFVPWGLVEGRQALWEAEADWRVMGHCDKLPVDDFSAQEQLFRGLKPPGAQSVRLSRGHSHLVLVDDGSTGAFGGEHALRHAFEAAACKEDEHEQQGRLAKALRDEGIGWQLMRVRDEPKKAKKEGRGVPALGICVHGDALALRSVAETVSLGNPVLLARRSGGAADLLADAVQLMRGRRNRAPSMESELHSLGGRSNSAEEAWDALSQCSASDAGGRRLSDPEHHHSPRRRDSLLSGEQEFIDQQRLAVLERLLNPSLTAGERAGLAVSVERVYGIARVKEFAEISVTVRHVAESGLCHIFDLERDDDLGGAMLAAILRKERDCGVEWKDCLELIVSWNKVGIMKRTLDRLRKVTARTRKAVEGAFHNAFINNKTEIAQCLLEHLECTSAYNVSYGSVGGGGLFSSVLMSLKQQKKQTSKAVMLWGHLACAALKHGYGFDGALVWERWADLYQRALMDEEARRLLESCRAPADYHAADKTSLSTFHSRARRVSLSSGTGRRASLGGGASLPSASAGPNTMQLLRRTNTQLARKVPTESAGPTRELEHVYKSLLGHEFWYETSAKGAELDLFLWSLLMRRKGMAKMLWARMELPIRSSLLAATLYRRWVKTMDLKMHIRESLIKDAEEFEQMAVEVQKHLMKNDANVALEAMERQSDLWKGLTGVDLAVMGNNEQFIERCCGEAIDCRWTGDIHPYGQRFGLYPTVLLSVFSLGLLAPNLLVFRPPPRAEAIRSPAQRRKIPYGYHEKPRAFEERYRDLEAVQEGRSMLLKLQKLHHAHERTGSTFLDELELRGGGGGGGGEVSGLKATWLERYRLFASAPVTIFMVDAIQQVVYNVLFTWMLVGDGALSRDMCWKELVLCWSVLSTSVYETLQLLLDGAAVYFSSSWNWFRALSCVLFWLGLASKTMGPSVAPGGQARQLHVCNLLYATSLFFMWMQVLHLLSVHRALGPLVIAFSRMRDDVIMFGTIWTVLLLAFATAMHVASHGAAPRNGTVEAVLPMQQWDLWWLVRTYFQSFGEMFYEELHTDASNIVMVVMAPVMNLMLVNLLVAIMNDTYSEVKEQSKLQWMVQMFYIAKEYRSPSRLNLALLVLDVVDYVRFRDNINRRTKKLSSHQPGFRGWLVDECFKFKRFLSRDLPAWERADEEEEISRHIQRLEEKELGTSSEDMQVGIPGRVWSRRQVEWHADVSSLGAHQFRRKEIAIKANLRGCVAVPMQLGPSAAAAHADPAADNQACVCIFFASRRVTAQLVDRIVIELHAAAGSPKARPIPALGAAAGSDAALAHLGLPKPSSFILGGNPRVASILETVAQRCDLAYAEAFRPSNGDGAMKVWGHASRGERGERFFRDSHGMMFPQNAASPAALSSSYESPLRSLSKSTLSRMSSEASMSSHASEVVEEAQRGALARLWFALFPRAAERLRARAAAKRAETKAKLKEQLSRLQQKRKQDEEAVRSIHKMAAQAKQDYLREHDSSNLLRMPDGFRKVDTSAGDGDI